MTNIPIMLTFIIIAQETLVVSGRPKCLLGHDHIPDPKDCHAFFHCWGYRMSHKTCGPYLLFNPKDKVCDWPSSVFYYRPECKKPAAKQHKKKKKKKKPDRIIFIKPVERSDKQVQSVFNAKKPQTLVDGFNGQFSLSTLTVFTPQNITSISP